MPTPHTVAYLFRGFFAGTLGLLTAFLSRVSLRRASTRSVSMPDTCPDLRTLHRWYLLRGRARFTALGLPTGPAPGKLHAALRRPLARRRSFGLRGLHRFLIGRTSWGLALGRCLAELLLARSLASLLPQSRQGRSTLGCWSHGRWPRILGLYVWEMPTISIYFARMTGCNVGRNVAHPSRPPTSGASVGRGVSVAAAGASNANTSTDCAKSD